MIKLIFILFILVSCKSDESFRFLNSGESVSGQEEIETPEAPTQSGENPGGIAEGHFDLDTSTRSYELERGDTNKHIHEYDDKYGVLGADFFSLEHRDLDEIDEVITNDTKRFVIITGNSHLSGSAFIEINGTTYTMKQYRDLMGDYSNLQRYVLGTPQVSGDIQLKSFRIFFPKNILAVNGLVASETKCVVGNDPHPVGGEYRNGALLAQVLDADQVSIDPVLKVATINSNSLLWEASFFWHKDVDCN